MTGRPRRIVFAIAALACTACGTCGTSGMPPPTAHAFPVQELTLPSGLKVVIEHDDVSSIAGIVVVVDAGSVDDPKGKSGTAHVLEHLVFRAAEQGGRSLWNQLVRMGAASFNAETDIERTTYHAFGPRQTLDQLVAAVLGRLADPLRGATEHDVAQELAITAEELRKKEGAQGWEFVVPALLPSGDPVGRAFAEHRRSDRVSLADLRAFSDAFYRPERMTVVISGPINFGWEKALFAKLPASWRGQEAKRTAPVRRPVAKFNGPASPDATLPTHAAKVNAPELWMAWRVPPAIGVDARKAFMISRVIDVVLSSRLDPDGTNDVLDVDGFAIPGALSTVVGCRFKLRAASDAIRIRNETKAALEALSDATLVHIKGRLYWSHVIALQVGTLMTALEMETIERRALVRADLAHGGSNALISTVLGALEKVTSEDLTDYAARYLQPEASRAVLVVPADARTPGGASDNPGNPSGPSGPSGPIVAPGAEPDRDGVGVEGDEVDLPDPGKLLATTQIPGARAALVRKLSNGLTVIAMRRPGLPFVSMILGFHADPQPGDAPGARYAYRRVLHWNLTEGSLERGLARWCDYQADQTQETLNMFAASVDKALDYLAEESDSLHVYWPNPVFERWLDGNAIDEATPEGKAAQTFRSALFGGHPYRLEPTTAEMRKVNERQVQSWFDRVRRPSNGVLIAVGELDPESLVRQAERMLHGWKGDRAPTAAPPAPPSPATRLPPDVVVAGSGAARAIYTEDARRRSADIQFGCFLPPVRTPRDEIVNRLLAFLLSDGLRSNLRWRKAVSYSPQVNVETMRGGTSFISGRVDVDARAQGDALDLLHLWLDDGAAMPVDPLRFEQLRWYTARRSGLMNATGRQLASSLFDAWNMGWEPAVLDDYPRDLAGVTAKDVTAALDVCRRSAVISVLGPGPDPDAAAGGR